MPFKGEPTGRLSHMDLAGAPEFAEFLSRCRTDTAGAVAKYKDLLEQCQSYAVASSLPAKLCSIDGSDYTSALNTGLARRKVICLRLGLVKMDLAGYLDLPLLAGGLIDPMAMQRLLLSSQALSVWLPGANVLYAGSVSSQDSFRLRFHEVIKTHTEALGNRSLLDTLYDAMSRLAQAGATADYAPALDAILFRHCPNPHCLERVLNTPVILSRASSEGVCPHCGTHIYASDILGLHESFTDAPDGGALVSHLRNTLEHLWLLHELQGLTPETAGQVGFVMDGPLALFGPSGFLHRAFMLVLSDLAATGGAPVVLGIQKTGGVLEFGRGLNELGSLKCGAVLPVSDILRFTYITPRPAHQHAEYGQRTSYGQDFVIKTHEGRLFALSLAYPVPDKQAPAFHQRFEVSAYPLLGSALGVLEAVESGLYGDSTVPQMLAHRFASISHAPGGRVLDKLVAERLSG